MCSIKSEQAHAEGIKGSVSFPHLLPCLHITACTGFMLATMVSLVMVIMVLPDSSQKAWTFSVQGQMGFADGGLCILSLICWPLRDGLSKCYQSHGRAGSEMNRARASCHSSSIQFEGPPVPLLHCHILPISMLTTS